MWVGITYLATGLASSCLTKVEEWVHSMTMRYHSKGRPLHNLSQLNINAKALTLWQGMNSQLAAMDGCQDVPVNGQPALVGVSQAQEEKPAEIIQTPEGKPMAVAHSQGADCSDGADAAS